MTVRRGPTLTIYTSPEIKDRMRIVAALRKTTMTEFINTAILKALDEADAGDLETRDFIARHTATGESK